MTDVATREHVAAARALKRAAALYDENRDLILMGAYARGSDQALDQAITAQPHVTGYLLQPEDEPVDMATSVRSEEHTSELQSLMRISYAVFCLKKKTPKKHA